MLDIGCKHHKAIFQFLIAHAITGLAKANEEGLGHIAEKIIIGAIIAGEICKVLKSLQKGIKIAFGHKKHLPSR